MLFSFNHVDSALTQDSHSHILHLLQKAQIWTCAKCYHNQYSWLIVFPLQHESDCQECLCQWTIWSLCQLVPQAQKNICFLSLETWKSQQTQCSLQASSTVQFQIQCCHFLWIAQCNWSFLLSVCRPNCERPGHLSAFFLPDEPWTWTWTWTLFLFKHGKSIRWNNNKNNYNLL